jgi:hypothetical protein
MQSEGTPEGGAGSPGDEGRTGPAHPRISRRDALGQISAGAAIGAVAWVAPEILTAKPAPGATLSGMPATGPSTFTSPTSTGSNPATASATTTATPPTTPSTASSLAMTGMNLQRDAEIGAIMVAGGWAMHKWASRVPHDATESAPAGDNAGSPGERT